MEEERKVEFWKEEKIRVSEKRKKEEEIFAEFFSTHRL